MQSPNQQEQNVELRMRTLRTLWIALFLSVAIYFVMTFFVHRAENARPNNSLFLILLTLGLFITLVSFFVKNKLLNRATELQQAPLVQQAYIVAWALTEIPALLGFLDYFATGDRYYYALFIISAFGYLLHLPRRENVINATFRNPPF
jgi:hypothetical protein